MTHTRYSVVDVLLHWCGLVQGSYPNLQNFQIFCMLQIIHTTIPAGSDVSLCAGVLLSGSVIRVAMLGDVVVVSSEKKQNNRNDGLLSSNSITSICVTAP